MRNAARAFKEDFDEVSVSQTEILEARVLAIHDELKEHKADFRELKAEFREHKAEFRAAIARIDNDIKNLAAKLEADIRASADKAAKDLQQFADRIEKRFAEMRSENAEVRKTLAELSGLVMKIDSRLSAIGWVCGGLIALVSLGLGIARAFAWI